MKAFVAETHSDQVLGLLAEASIAATSRLSYVECRAAFSRALREGRMGARDERTAARTLDQHWEQLLVVELDHILAREAATLTLQYPLRAADAVHLASALVFCGSPTQDTSFACWDHRLWEAAVAVGFRAIPAEAP